MCHEGAGHKQLLHITHSTQLCQCPSLPWIPTIPPALPNLGSLHQLCSAPPSFMASVQPPLLSLLLKDLIPVFWGCWHCWCMQRFVKTIIQFQNITGKPADSIRCNLSHISDPESKVLKESSSHFLFANLNENHLVSGYAPRTLFSPPLPIYFCFNYFGSRTFRDLVVLTLVVIRVLSPRLNKDFMLLSCFTEYAHLGAFCWNVKMYRVWIRDGFRSMWEGTDGLRGARTWKGYWICCKTDFPLGIMRRLHRSIYVG